jgi:hypothetical protein
MKLLVNNKPKLNNKKIEYLAYSSFAFNLDSDESVKPWGLDIDLFSTELIFLFSKINFNNC